MGDLATYDVTVNGERTQMNLSEEDAKRLGGKLVVVAIATTATPKPVEDPPPAKGRPVLNKARTAGLK